MEIKPMRTFELIRGADESGVSGIGKVLEGVVFGDGTTVVRWCVIDKPNSTAVYDNFEQFLQIHVTSHPTNKTEVVWKKPVKEELIDRIEKCVVDNLNKKVADSSTICDIGDAIREYRLDKFFGKDE